MIPLRPPSLKEAELGFEPGSPDAPVQRLVKGVERELRMMGQQDVAIS